MDKGAPQARTVRNFRRLYFVGALAAALLATTLISLWHSPPEFLTCPSRYPECSGKSPEPMPEWEIPDKPAERAAYDQAHALQLPPCVDKPVIYDYRRTYPVPHPPPCQVPFNFRAARIAESKGGPEVAEQYFDHLCRTEAGEFIFRQAKDVEGVYLMRPQKDLMNGPLDFDRYRPEDPTGIREGEYSDPKSRIMAGYDGLPIRFIQPFSGQYLYLEQPDWEQPGQIFRYVRKINYSSTWIDETAEGVQLPLLVVREWVTERKAKYGVTWRGLRRPRDREFAIAGSERLIVDLSTNEVLAVRRVFKKSGKDRRKSRIWWANSRECSFWNNSSGSYFFAPRVLLPRPHVNDDVYQYVEK